MGWGRIGQHRKSGSRGGYGAAGLGKHEWTWTIKYAPNWFGKKGFRPPRIRVNMEVRAVNVGFVDELARVLEAKGEAAKEGDMVVIDLQSQGIHKLLGGGKAC